MEVASLAFLNSALLATDHVVAVTGHEAGAVDPRPVPAVARPPQGLAGGLPTGGVNALPRSPD